MNVALGFCLLTAIALFASPCGDTVVNGVAKLAGADALCITGLKTAVHPPANGNLNSSVDISAEISNPNNQDVTGSIVIFGGYEFNGVQGNGERKSVSGQNIYTTPTTTVFPANGKTVTSPVLTLAYDPNADYHFEFHKYLVGQQGWDSHQCHSWNDTIKIENR